MLRTITACHDVSGIRIPLTLIFKGVRDMPELQGVLRRGSTVVKSDLGYVNEVLFLYGLTYLI